MKNDPPPAAGEPPEADAPWRGGKAIVRWVPPPRSAFSGVVLDHDGPSRAERIRARLAISGVLIVLLGSAVLAGYLTQDRRTDGNLVLPPASTVLPPKNASPAGEQASSPATPPGKKPEGAPKSGTSSPGTPSPGAPAAAAPAPGTAAPGAGASSPAGSPVATASLVASPTKTPTKQPTKTPTKQPTKKPTKKPTEERSTLAARHSGFSPIACDAPAPADLPRTPRKDAARGVNGWTLPSGWSYFADGTGPHLAVPDGWTYQRVGAKYCFRDPEGPGVMSLDLGRDPADDPLKAVQAEDRRLRTEGRITGYDLVRIETVPLLHKAADWDARYRDEDGILRRATTRWLTIEGRAYAIGWATTDDTWSKADAELQMVRTTFYASRPTTGAGAEARRG